MAIDIAAIRARAAAMLAEQNKTATTRETVAAETVAEEQVIVYAEEVAHEAVAHEAVTKVSQKSEPTPLTAGEQIISRITELQQSLQQNLPQYESLLYTIHKELHSNEDVVHLLTDEQIGTIVAALSKKKGIVLATMAAKSTSGSKTPSGKKLKDLTLSDL